MRALESDVDELRERTAKFAKDCAKYRDGLEDAYANELNFSESIKGFYGSLGDPFGNAIGGAILDRFMSSVQEIADARSMLLGAGRVRALRAPPPTPYPRPRGCPATAPSTVDRCCSAEYERARARFLSLTKDTKAESLRNAEDELNATRQVFETARFELMSQLHAADSPRTLSSLSARWRSPWTRTSASSRSKSHPHRPRTIRARGPAAMRRGGGGARGGARRPRERHGGLPGVASKVSARRGRPASWDALSLTSDRSRARRRHAQGGRTMEHERRRRDGQRLGRRRDWKFWRGGAFPPRRRPPPLRLRVCLGATRSRAELGWGWRKRGFDPGVSAETQQQHARGLEASLFRVGRARTPDVLPRRPRRSLGFGEGDGAAADSHHQTRSGGRPQHAFLFPLRCPPEKTYCLQAESQADRARWMEAITTAIAGLLNNADAIQASVSAISSPPPRSPERSRFADPPGRVTRDRVRLVAEEGSHARSMSFGSTLGGNYSASDVDGEPAGEAVGVVGGHARHLLGEGREARATSSAWTVVATLAELRSAPGNDACAIAAWWTRTGRRSTSA